MEKTFALSANYGYIVPVTTLIKSLVIHNSHSKIYLLNCDIPQEWFAIMNYRIKKFSCQLIDRKVDPGIFNGLSSRHQHINAMTYGRLLIPRFIKEDIVVYLDSDTIVTRDLSELFQLDLTDYLFAAAPNMAVGDRFNAGVLVINNRYFHQHPEILEQLLETAHNKKNIEADQTLLNNLVGDHFLPLPTKYNYMIGYDQDIHFVLKDELKYVNEIEDVSSPSIIHFASGDKPWNLLSTCRLRDKWWNYNSMEWQTKGITVQKQNFKGHILIFTYSADFFHLEELIEALPNYQFNICTVVQCNWELVKLTKYPNVHLYQYVIPQVRDKLIKQADLYLDIAFEPKDDGIPQRFLNVGKPVLTFDAGKNTKLCNSFFYESFPNDDIEGMTTRIQSLCKENKK